MGSALRTSINAGSCSWVSAALTSRAVFDETGANPRMPTQMGDQLVASTESTLVLDEPRIALHVGCGQHWYSRSTVSVDCLADQDFASAETMMQVLHLLDQARCLQQ